MITSATEVLIVGAGPTGLVLALWLSRLGVRVRIIDKTTAPGTTSRALAVQARTLELYRQVDLADAVVERGRKVEAINLWAKGRRVAHAVLGDIGAGISPYPYPLVFPQDEHERLLVERLSQAGVIVERATTLESFEETGGKIVARLRRDDGTAMVCEAPYLAGCDGAHSSVRQGLAIGFPGGTYEHLFYVADVVGSGPAVDAQLHVALDESDFLAVFPLKEDGHVRLVGTVRAESENKRDLAWDDVSSRVIQWMRIDVDHVQWFSTYRVHHRVAGEFRRGRAFLLGDAAHVHSPAGGQGMNTGIGDAVNLAWKLAAVLGGRADSAVLDTYESERIGFARRLVATTDQAFAAATSDRFIARIVRLDVIPIVVPLIFKFGTTRRFMFRTVSQTVVNYRESNLSAGRAGAVHAGDRLPWVTTGGGHVNFEPLTAIDWQVHVYGTATSQIATVCQQIGLPLHTFPWQPEFRRSGLEQNATYLIRPDGYIGLADASGRADVITSYLDSRQLKNASRATSG